METRSLQQNRYYWKVIIRALMKKAEAEGNPIGKDYAHRLAMLAVDHCEYVERWGLVTLEPKPTHNMSVQAYEELLEKIRAWGAQYLKIGIDLPNEGITYPRWGEDFGHAAH